MSKPRSRIDKLIYGTSHVGHRPIVKPKTPTVCVIFTDQPLCHGVAMSVEGVVVEMDKAFNIDNGITTFTFKMYEKDAS